jgi:hypothetical protein
MPKLKIQKNTKGLMATKARSLTALQAANLTDNLNWQHLLCLSSIGSAPRPGCCHLGDGVWKCILDSVFVHVLILTFPRIS